jgi:hypothetical protein
MNIIQCAKRVHPDQKIRRPDFREGYWLYPALPFEDPDHVSYFAAGGSFGDMPYLFSTDDLAAKDWEIMK